MTFVLLLSIVAACGRTERMESADIGEVSFSFGTIPAKSPSGFSDDHMEMIEAAIFDGGKQLSYGAKYVDSPFGTITLSHVPSGRRLSCVASANSGGLLQGSSYDSFMNRTLYLRDYSVGHIPMISSFERSFSSGSSTVTVSMHRIASKIHVDRVRTAFKSEELVAADVRIKAIYLYYAPGSCLLNSEEDKSAVRYHCGEYSSDDESDLGNAAALAGSNHLDIDISGNVSRDLNMDLYCCPCHDTKTWLTFKVEVKGEVCYYGVSIGELQANARYVIKELVITDLGNDNPPGKVDKEKLIFSIAVQDWEEGQTQSVEF